MFSPISHYTIRFRRYSGWLLVLLSFFFHIFTVYCFSKQPDRLAAFTVLPLWFWGVIGLSIAVTALLLLRASLSLILSFIWILTIFVGSDEAKVLSNIGTRAPIKGGSATISGSPIIRVLTLNCKNFTEGNPTNDILAWNADIILLQEIHPYFVKGICDKAYQDKGFYRVHHSSGIISRWPIKRDGRIDQFRDHQCTIQTPYGSTIEVMNVHLGTAATDARLWLRECWRTHKNNRLFRRNELGAILQTLDTTASPIKNAVIIGGDYNAPAQDATYRLMDRDYQDAYLQAGCGWSNTFPRSLPMMRLDHIYISSQLKCVRATAETVTNSDHRILVTDLIRVSP